MGTSYKEHLKRLNEYIAKHPDTNITNPMEFYYMDERTNPQYIIQAFICHLVFSEKGINGLKQLLKIESMDEIFRSEFFVEPDNQNKFIREQIKKYVDSSLSL